MNDQATLPWQPYAVLSDSERIGRARSFRDAMGSRRSCRAFQDAPVPREVIEAAIQAAASAPNGANRQPWHFVVVSSPEAKCAIRVAAEEEERRFYEGRAGGQWLSALWPLGTGPDKPYLETAPWIIIAFAQRWGGTGEDDQEQNYYVTESVGIACGLLLATLHQAGLATLVHTPNPMRFLNRVCGRPDQEKAVMMIVTGHAAGNARIPRSALEKKPLEQITSWL
ncbi:nitroreductase family protein [Sphingomonas sp. S2-65]|uniref:nitroreductase family protein n=1 Tax=Sphingomonas sp. S2-65 TaxID=2903960 RepID=UPI001F17B406|nr:nitroreductase family protein [Sphingomonas sp. S2-65]UYY58452.1 nitroreductase family protein [Sphingomonas sp. S2-65]